MEQMYEDHTIEDERAELIQVHSATHHPRGQPPEAASVQRPASEAGSSGPDARGIELPQDETALTNEAELAQSAGPLPKSQGMGQALYFTESGHLWVWGAEDDVLSAGCGPGKMYYELVHQVPDMQEGTWSVQPCDQPQCRACDRSCTCLQWSALQNNSWTWITSMVPSDMMMLVGLTASHVQCPMSTVHHWTCPGTQATRRIPMVRSLERPPPSSMWCLAASQSAHTLCTAMLLSTTTWGPYSCLVRGTATGTGPQPCTSKGSCA